MSGRKLCRIVLSCLCLAAGIAAAGTKATAPDPADGALAVTMAVFEWTKGTGAVLHNVYLGTTPDLTEADLVAARHKTTSFYYSAGQLESGATYYWRVDEILADGVTVVTGDVWCFTMQAVTAYYPSPTDGAADVGLAPTLTWLAGLEANQHQLYFSDSLDAVTQGAAEADKGTLDLDTTSFVPGSLEKATTYYWRVDEIPLFGGAAVTGPVWKFTTILPVEDFEIYDDNDLLGTTIWQTWIDGFSDNSSGSTVGYMEAPFAEQAFIHSGLQSMPFDYNNVDEPYYSEAMRAFEGTMDWTVDDLSTLTLFFRGRSSNSVERLYVIVEDDGGKSGVAVYADANDLAVPVWTRWEIPLSTFTDAGVDLAAVENLYIGVGDPDNPTPGGRGILFFDDIYVAGPGVEQPDVVFAEDFDGLVLGPNVDEGVAGEAVWTKTAPAGWTIDDSGIPGAGDVTQDGVTEWAGWSFASRIWWADTGGDQRRTEFTKGTGTVAIADPDEWDDVGHAEGRYNTYLSTPAIDISAAKAGTLLLTFDSSWRPEFADYGEQSAKVTVAFDGGEPEQLMLWLSDTASQYFKPDAVNDTVTIKIPAPADAQTMVLTFGLFNAGNNWFWAIDNVLVTGTLQ